MEWKGKQCDQNQKHEQSQGCMWKTRDELQNILSECEFVSWKGHLGLGNSIRDCWSLCLLVHSHMGFLHNLRSDKIWFTSRMSYLLLSVSWLRKAREKHPKEKMVSSKSCFCWVTAHYMLHKKGVPVCFCSPTEFPGSDCAWSGGHALDKYSLLLNGSSVLWLILSLSQRRKWLG